MVAIRWALRIDTTPAEEERICNGEVGSHRHGSREGSKRSSSEKRSRLAETNLGRRIYNMAAFGRSFYRILENGLVVESA